VQHLAEYIVKETRSETRIFKNNLELDAASVVKLLHVPIALDLGLVAVDTSFHLACERKQVLVDDLGGLPVPLVLLGLLDVKVHELLRLKPLSTAFIRAGERALAGVVHEVELQAGGVLESCRAAWISAGESWRLGVLPADVSLQVGGIGKSFSTVLLFADERPFAQVHGVVVTIKIGKC